MSLCSCALLRAHLPLYKPPGDQLVTLHSASSPAPSPPAPHVCLCTPVNPSSPAPSPQSPHYLTPKQTATRYPLVGQGLGFGMASEKPAPNPAYAHLRPRYLEPRPPREDPDEPPHRSSHSMPSLHKQPWLAPGKHLVVDVSVPPPEVDTPAGAPPSATLTSSYRRAENTNRSSSKGPVAGGAKAAATAKKPGAGGKATGKSGAGKGKGKGKVKVGSGSENDDSEEEEDAGDRQVLAVIGGVRLMSMMKRGEAAEEFRRQVRAAAGMREGRGWGRGRGRRSGLGKGHGRRAANMPLLGRPDNDCHGGVQWLARRGVLSITGTASQLCMHNRARGRP